MRKRLLQERNLDLKKCIDLCRSSEAAALHLKNISGSNNTIHDVNKVHEHAGRNLKPVRQQNYDRNARNDGNKKQAITGIDCKFCGRNHPRKKELCPAWQKRCQKCNGRNHFAAVCGKTISRGGVNYVSEQRDDSSNDSSEYEFLAGITEEPVINAVKQTSGFAKEVYTEMKINDKKINFQIDCGASINVITECHATGSNIIPSNKTLKMWNDSELKPLGTTRLIVRNPKTEKKYSI